MDAALKRQKTKKKEKKNNVHVLQKTWEIPEIWKREQIISHNLIIISHNLIICNLIIQQELHCI